MNNMDYFFKHPEFNDKWKFYNEYLLEDHGIILDESGIKKRLTKLDKLCKGDIKKACMIINIMIGRGETQIFMPNDDELY